MITDEDVLEKEDMHILDRVRDFCLKAEVTTSVAAAKQLVVLIDRVVRCCQRSRHVILIFCIRSAVVRASEPSTWRFRLLHPQSSLRTPRN